MARKGRLFADEARRLLCQYWDSLRFVTRVPYHKVRVREAIRRAMVRAYKRGLEDGKEKSCVE